MFRCAGGKRVLSGPSKSLVFRRSPGLLILALILILSRPSDGGSAGGFTGVIPFYPGEKLTYEGKWGPIPAGEVTLEVLPRETIGGIETHHLTMTTRTNDVVDLLYKIRERQDSFIDSGMTRSILYKQRTEGKYPRDIIVTFDWDTQEATRSNFGEKSAPVKIRPGTFDPLALIYVLRLQDLRGNAGIDIPVTDGLANFAVKAIVGKRDTIEIQGEMYPVFAVTPDMKRLESLTQNEHPLLKLWFTADEKQIPVRMMIRVGILSLTFELARKVR